MPELGEEVSVDTIASIDHDEYCYFCNAKEEPRTEENELGDDYDEDLDLDGPFDGKFKNDAGKLGKALGTSTTREIEVDGVKLDVTSAAHHLIPGNGSLKKSTLFKSNKYLWTDGRSGGNIGYSVNSAPNGVWLPGNYAVRPWSTRSPDFQREYAYAAMRESGAQFHDAHKKYGEFVLGVLDKIHDKLEAMESILCPESKKKMEQAQRDPRRDPPLRDLVARLHTVSGRMRGLLTGTPEKHWRMNVYTSSHAESLMNDLLRKHL